MRVAVVGATGAVGHAMTQILQEREFPVTELVPLASSRSAGRPIRFRDDEYITQELSLHRLEGVHHPSGTRGGHARGAAPRR